VPLIAHSTAGPKFKDMGEWQVASSKIWVQSSSYTQQQLQFFINNGSFIMSFEDGACTKILASDEGLLALQEFFPNAILSEVDNRPGKLSFWLPPAHLKENRGWAVEGFTFFVGKKKTHLIKGKEKDCSKEDHHSEVDGGEEANAPSAILRVATHETAMVGAGDELVIHDEVHATLLSHHPRVCSQLTNAMQYLAGC
jgi:hypothetical protein